MTQTKTEMIEDRLRQAFTPAEFQVIDESDQHIGHAGHQGGGRHFAIVIKSEVLQGLPRVTAHQRIYDVLSDLIPHEIHALRIKIEK